MSALRFLLIALCALPLTTANAAAQRLGGMVRDALTENAVPGASVTAIDARGVAHGTVISDSAGTFHFPLPRAEHYQLRVDHAEYASHTSNFIRVRRGESIAVELRLGRQVSELAPLIVIARRRHPVSRLAEFNDRMDRQKKIGLGRFITRADIEQSASIDVHAVLQREPSIAIVRVAPPPTLLGSNAGAPPSPEQILRAAATARAAAHPRSLP
jgi:hypothetical protein